jgi:hypothetical protein
MTFDLNQFLEGEARSVHRLSVTVTLDGEERTYYSKPLRPVDMQVVRRKYGDHIEHSMHAEAMCFLLIQKLETEDGKKALKQSAFESLIRIPLDQFVTPVFQGLFADYFNKPADETLEDRLGNSEATTS